MVISFQMLAQLPPDGGLPTADSSGPFFSPQTRDMLVIAVGALIAVTVAVVIIIINRRRQFKVPDSKPPETGDKDQRQRFFRARGSNPADEPTHRNPTLAERGGLPPLKDKPGNSSK